MAFKLLKDAQETEYVKVRIASQAYTLGDLVMLDRTADAIDVVPATSSTFTANVYGVAMETVTSAATELLICVVTPWQEWVADATNASVVNDKMERMVLSNASTVNNTHTDSTAKEAIFMQTGVIGALSDKKLVGKILKVANVTA